MKRRGLLLILLLVFAAGLQAYTFGQNKLNLQPEEWSQIQTMHFDVYFPAQADSFGKLAALMAEETYYLLRSELTFPAGSRIPLIIYRSKSGFQNTNVIYPLLPEGVGGFTESLHNRVAIPFEGSYRDLEVLLAHELTHAYLNTLDKSALNSLASLSLETLPMWFSEGLPEFFSMGGLSDYNNMFIHDMVVNDKLPGLENVNGYYAYRLGESFLAYIAQTWGRSKVAEYFYALRSVRNLDSATRKVFGLKFEDLEERWRFQLKRQFYPLMAAHGIPNEQLERRTDSDKDGSYLNFMPRFSPNGERYVYFSTVSGRYSIWMAGRYGLAEPRKILAGESSGKVEEFYYFRSSLSWFPDNRRVAFAAKTSRGDRIHILDVEKGKIVQTLPLKQFDAIYEADVAPDGRSIVFAGQIGMQCDLYLYNLETAELRQLTNDLYNDAQPRFASDGASVVFASERSREDLIKRQGFFGGLVSQIFSLDLQNGELVQHTWSDRNCSFPQLDQSGAKLLYVTSQDGVSNVFALDRATGGQARVTDVLAGVFCSDLAPDGKQLLLANYFDGAWDIYIASGLSDTLSFTPAQPPVVSDPQDKLLEGIDLGNLDYFGKREKQRPSRTNPAAAYGLRDPFLGEPAGFEFTPEDSLQLVRDYSYDDRPLERGKPIQSKPYRAKFALDNLWGGLAYSPSVGTVGYVELSLSDLMGNHGIGVQAEIAGKLEDSNLLLSYLFLKRRTDYGLGVFNLFDEVYVRQVQTGLDDYYRFRERQSGLYFLTRYPFSRFFRVELDHLVYQRGRYKSSWIWDDPAGNTGHWSPNEDLGQSYVYTPGLRLVHDNSLYGPTGPLLGWRAFYNLSATLANGKIDYVTNYLDWRSYTLFSKRYSFALRALGGISTGSLAQRFDLGGYNGVRGYTGNLSGEKKALLAAELRFPFIEYLSLAFPLPLTLPNVRGSLFADLGTVFDEYKNFRGADNGTLRDLHLSYGCGPRLDLGFLLLRFDVVWMTDFASHSKPTYYLSLSEDF